MESHGQQINKYILWLLLMPLEFRSLPTTVALYETVYMYMYDSFLYVATVL